MPKRTNRKWTKRATHEVPLIAYLTTLFMCLAVATLNPPMMQRKLLTTATPKLLMSLVALHCSVLTWQVFTSLWSGVRRMQKASPDPDLLIVYKRCWTYSLDEDLRELLILPFFVFISVKNVSKKFHSVFLVANMASFHVEIVFVSFFF